nr:prolyl oligopeptidase family serine peptidase [Kineococcus vitellinus]
MPGRGTGGGPWPVLTWCHGSAFRRDDGRRGADAVAAVLAPLGVAVAGVAVRSSAQALFPAQREDVAAALGFLHEQGGRFGLDGRRVVAAGESSGGWAAAMGALTTDLTRGAVAFYPPTDLLAMDAQAPPGASLVHDDAGSPESQLLGAPVQTVPELARAASPVSHVHPGAPPFLLVHGALDELVPAGQSRALAQALERAGVDVTHVEVPDAGHGVWREWIGRPDVVAFVRARLGVAGG